MARRRRRNPQPPPPPAPARPSTGGWERVPDQAPPAPAATTPARSTQNPGAAPRPPVAEVAGRFATAPQALRCLGMLAGADRAHAARILTGAEGYWWITAAVELDLGRSAVHTADGTTYVNIDGLLVRDRGFGAPPVTAGETGDAGVKSGSLDAVGLLDLVRAAGLHPARPQPLHDAVLLAPGPAASGAVRRCLELGLEVSYRPVRLHPLFGDEAEPGAAAGTWPADAGSSVLVEVTLRRSSSPVPASLLAALARYPLAMLGRPAGSGLLIQHRLSTPLPDEQLAALAGEDTWVLADAAFGCWRREPLGEPAPGSGLVRLDDGFPLTVERPSGEQHTVPPTAIRLVPARLPGQRVDAVLLDDGDLGNLALLLEHHPLADIAVLVPGRDRHLVLAAGGTLEDLAIGEPLACVGPGPLYVPVGHRLSPRLPPSARSSLFAPDPHHAVVILDGHGLRFFLDHRRPVWTLWVGDAPAVDTQLPQRSAHAVRDLARLEPQPAASMPQPTPRWRSGTQPAPTPPPWREEALAAELAGDLVRAADLHRRHNEPLRAAHLYERAAHSQQRDRP